jgi:antitoxin (DNA-binding transcriptional repressor) of toxin-antitoxin stability system
MLTEVEHGETLVVLRRGRPIAEVSPVREQKKKQLSWKQAGLRLLAKGAGLSSAIIEEREG